MSKEAKANIQLLGYWTRVLWIFSAYVQQLLSTGTRVDVLCVLVTFVQMVDPVRVILIKSQILS